LFLRKLFVKHSLFPLFCCSCPLCSRNPWLVDFFSLQEQSDPGLKTRGVCYVIGKKNVKWKIYETRFAKDRDRGDRARRYSGQKLTGVTAQVVRTPRERKKTTTTTAVHRSVGNSPRQPWLRLWTWLTRGRPSTGL
jgi:hypothetical protein